MTDPILGDGHLAAAWQHLSDHSLRLALSKDPATDASVRAMLRGTFLHAFHAALRLVGEHSSAGANPDPFIAELNLECEQAFARLGAFLAAAKKVR